MASLISACLLLLVLESAAQDTPCTFDPDFFGEFVTSLWGAVDVMDSTITLTSDDLGVGQHVLNALQCVNTFDDGTFLLRSANFIQFDVEFSAFTCANVTKVNGNYFQIDFKTGKNKDGLPLKIQVASDDTVENMDKDSICGPDTTTMGVFIRPGQESSAATTGSTFLDGLFKVNFLDADLVSECPDGADLRSCDQPTSPLVFSSPENCVLLDTSFPPGTGEFLPISSTDMEVTLLMTSSQDDTTSPFSCLRRITEETSAEEVFALSPLSCSGTWKPSDEEDAVSTQMKLDFSAPCTDGTEGAIPFFGDLDVSQEDKPTGMPVTISLLINTQLPRGVGGSVSPAMTSLQTAIQTLLQILESQ